MFKEFQEFISRGNVMDLAVAVVMGAAFTAIIDAIVDNIIAPLLGIVLGGIDFSGLSINVGDAMITYGVFIQAVINFFIIAIVLFLMIRSINKLQRKMEGKLDVQQDEEPPPEPSTEEKLLTEIRDLLKANAAPKP